MLTFRDNDEKRLWLSVYQSYAMQYPASPRADDYADAAVECLRMRYTNALVDNPGRASDGDGEVTL